MRTPTTRLLFASCALSLACKDKGEDSAITWDTAPEEEICASDDECGEDEICDDGACVIGDRNEDFESAESIVWESENDAYLHDGDVDYYTFNAEGGEFIRLSTIDLDDDEDLDTIVSLYDPNGKLHHQEDDHAIGSVSTYDTVLYAYLHVAGAWTVVVEDDDGVGTGDYQLILTETSAHTRESDSEGSPSYSLDVTSSSSIWAIGVALEEPGDADWIELTLPWDECPVYLYGSTYTNGTDADATVELYDADGQLRLRKEGLGPEGVGYYPEIDGQTVYLAAKDSLDGGGDNYWFFIYVSVGDQGSSYAAEFEPNDSQISAENTAFEWDANEWGDFAYSSHWGSLGSFGDEDWYVVSVPADYLFSVSGSADGYGSSLSPTVEIYDGGGALVASDSADATDSFPDYFNLELDEGTYYVRITSEDLTSYGEDFYYTVSFLLSDYTLAGNDG